MVIIEKALVNFVFIFSILDTLDIIEFSFFGSGLAFTILPRRIQKILHHLIVSHCTYSKHQTRVLSANKMCYNSVNYALEEP